MPDYDYIVIGGGISGLGALTSLILEGHNKIALFEARDTLMYTNTWMKNIKLPDGKERNYTGADYREKVLNDLEHNNIDELIFTGKRVFYIDQKEQRIHLRTSSGEKEEYSYGTLVVAVGAAQIMYGKYLLPGTRGGRFFTTYQVGEMIEYYPFVPGSKLVIFGESLYASETALSARAAGLSVTVVSPSKINLPDNWPDDIVVHNDAVLKQVYGDTLFEGMLIQCGSASINIPGDSLAVDGDFVLEHPWRKHLAVEWDLNKWELDLSREEMKTRNLIVVGDAYRPDPDFIKQFRSGSETIKQFIKLGANQV